MGSLRKKAISARLAVGALTITLCAALLMAFSAEAQDIPIGVTYVCSGEHIYIENCNIRDTSDTSNCMVAHPDKLLPNGMNSYTYVSRGALKKLLPTCTQPSAKQAAAAKAFQQKQQDIYNANVAKSEAQMRAPAQAAAQANAGSVGQIAPPKDAEERAMRRCVSSGRLPASCTGNQLLGAFSQMLGSVLPGVDKPAGPASGANMAGVFEGAGELAAGLYRWWRAGELRVSFSQSGELFAEVRERPGGIDYQHAASAAGAELPRRWDDYGSGAGDDQRCCGGGICAGQDGRAKGHADGQCGALLRLCGQPSS